MKVEARQEMGYETHPKIEDRAAEVAGGLIWQLFGKVFFVGLWKVFWKSFWTEVGIAVGALLSWYHEYVQ